MKSGKKIFLILFMISLAVVIVVYLFLFQGNEIEKEKILPEKNFSLADEKKGEPGYIALLEDNSLLYFYYGGGKSEYYRYDFQTGEHIKIGEIQNFSLDAGSYVKIRDAVYFYVSRQTSNQNSSALHDDTLQKEEEGRNYLYKIDLKENTLEQITEEGDTDLSLPGLFISSLGDSSVTLKNENKDGKIITYLEFYNTESEQLEKTEKAVFDPEKKEGEAYYICHGNGERLYVIKDIYENGICKSVLSEYDQERNLMWRVFLDEEEIKNFFKQGRIYKMDSAGEEFSLFSTSGEGYLGRIQKNGEQREIQTLFQMEGLCSVMDARNFEKTESMFYVKGENYLLFSNLTKNYSRGGLKQVSLKVEEGTELRLRSALKNGETLFLVMEDEAFRSHCYLLKRSEIEEYLFS